MRPFIPLLAGITILLSSCAYHQGNLSAAPTQKPVVYKDVSIGTSKSIIVFNIGGLSKDALVFDAKKKMMENRKLTGSEMYGDISVDLKRTWFIIGVKTKVTVIADVIEEKTSPEQESYSQVYKEKMFVADLDSGLFTIGDSVYYTRTKKAAILAISSSTWTATIEFTNKKEAQRSKDVGLNDLFVVRDSWRGLKLGGQWQGGEIIAFGIDAILVKDAQDDNVIFSYSQ